MHVERCIDYMQFSAYMEESICFGAKNEDGTRKYEPVSPVRFYKRGYRDKFGIRYYFGAPRGNKCLVIASGEPMENLRSLRNDYEILNWALEAGAKFSRLDLAVTQWQDFTGLITLEDIKSWSKQGLITSCLMGDGLVKGISSIQSNQDTLETLYIGDMQKRAKRGIFRAYNKGIELELGDYMATRLELELKRDRAHIASLRIAKTNDIAGNFRAYFDVKHPDFIRLMDADAVSTKRGKAKMRVEENEANMKRWEWLINQVAPALKSAIKHDRELGKLDVNLTKFLKEAGLLQEMMDTSVSIADMRYRSQLIDNGLL